MQYGRMFNYFFSVIYLGFIEDIRDDLLLTTSIMCAQKCL